MTRLADRRASTPGREPALVLSGGLPLVVALVRTLVRTWVLPLLLAFGSGAVTATEEPFRPEPGTFPPLDKAHAYRGELVFVDHANRRGSVRVQGSGMFFRNDPHPFALLPYGIVRFHGAPADLRDIPLGTVLHVHAFLPPDPRISSVPVLPVDNKTKDANHNRGSGIAPAENHVLLLEDEPSHCLREGLAWKLVEVDVKNEQGTLVARREPRDGGSGTVGDATAAGPPGGEKLSFDAATRLWRGRERLTVGEWIAEGGWPADGKRSLEGRPVLLGITWKPTRDGVFTQFHVSDIWLDEAAIERAAEQQRAVHRAFIRSRWMPARIDAVEYGSFGRAIVTATLFGGMDAALYDDFKKGGTALINAVENTLKHTHGAYGPGHMASRGPILDVVRTPGEAPLGSSGIQIRVETDLIIEGIRPGRTVRVNPGTGIWPQVNVPREEYLDDGSASAGERFPTPAIFPKY